jgi:hypothetical protein
VIETCSFASSVSFWAFFIRVLSGIREISKLTASLVTSVQSCVHRIRISLDGFGFEMDAGHLLVVEWPTETAYIEIDFHINLLIHRSLPASINDSVHPRLT